MKTFTWFGELYESKWKRSQSNNVKAKEVEVWNWISLVSSVYVSDLGYVLKGEMNLLYKTFSFSNVSV